MITLEEEKKKFQLKEIPDMVFYFGVALLFVALVGNVYTILNPNIVEIPVLYNVTPDNIIDKSLLLNYNERANIICAVNNFGNGSIKIDNARNDVYILCYDGEKFKELNLTYAEIMGEGTKIK